MTNIILRDKKQLSEIQRLYSCEWVSEDRPYFDHCRSSRSSVSHRTKPNERTKGRWYTELTLYKAANLHYKHASSCVFCSHADCTGGRVP